MRRSSAKYQFAGRREHQMLLACGRSQIDSDTTDRLNNLLAQHIDWPYLLRLARPHGMIPLLHRHLATCVDRVPTTVMETLGAACRTNTRNNLLLTGELLALLDLFDAHDIPALPYKGPVLAASVYHNLSLRQSGDLDILVSTSNVAQARTLLIARGYRFSLQLTPSQEQQFLRTQCEFALIRDDGVIVELHWGVAPRHFAFPLRTEDLWTRRTSVLLAGRRIPSLSPEDLLLVLCVHGFKHRWERVEWICGVAELLRSSTALRWPDVVERSGALRARRIVLLGLLLAHELLGAPLPAEILQPVRHDPTLSALGEWVRRRLFESEPHPLAVVERALFQVRGRDRWRETVRCGLLSAMTPTHGDWNFLPLPNALSFVYYGLRPVRLAGTYGRNLLRQWTTSKPTAS